VNIDTVSTGVRYAVYFAPEANTPLARFGRSWLGHDPETGEEIARETFGLEPAMAEHAIATPSLYGLHGTLKPPFQFQEGRSVESLKARLAAMAHIACPVNLGRLAVTRLGNFLALQPEHSPKAQWLAAHCMFAVEDFRAPMTCSEKKRRLQADLTRHQRLLLELYGYPYVLSEYRFHITLTGPLDDAEHEIVGPALVKALGHITAETVHIKSICLFVQRAAGERFRIVSRWPLSA